ncbi:MAG: L,D-transpeptidase, partial [Muribaculaceae bacterium]|nr:L,D-transpeptidase [Muribaculaceae bacterium]
APKPAKTKAPKAAVAQFTKYYDGKFDKKKSFIVISKLNETLSVYADIDGDTTLVARYPVCLSKNKGNKQKVGDMKTPESTMEKPFTIQQIQDASTWHHDFKDGRGNIRAYGNWFLRLRTPGHSGIGIHGSTNNESSVPGRASEGCIRLRDADIDNLKANYAYVGMPVIIHAEDEPNYPFEQ